MSTLPPCCENGDFLWSSGPDVAARRINPFHIAKHAACFACCSEFCAGELERLRDSVRLDGMPQDKRYLVAVIESTSTVVSHPQQWPGAALCRLGSLTSSSDCQAAGLKSRISNLKSQISHLTSQAWANHDIRPGLRHLFTWLSERYTCTVHQ